MQFQLLGVFERIFPEQAASGTMTVGTSLLISLIGFLIVFAVLGVIALFVKGMSGIFDTINAKKKPEQAEETSAAVAVAAPATFTGVKLEGTSEKEAAAIMAIVSKECGIPLEKLQFNSIKYMGDKK